MSEYLWRLPELMRRKQLMHSTALQRQLAESGVRLSRQAVYRLIRGKPDRLSIRTLMAICDILACTPNDLIQRSTEPSPDLHSRIPAPPQFFLRKTM